MRKIYLAGFYSKTILVLFFVIVFRASDLYAQVDITIGTGTNANTTTTYPCPFGDWWEGQRQQYLYLASELSAAGMSAGTINAIRFNVLALTTSTGANPAVEQYTIKIATTSTASLGATSWEPVTATVYGPVNYLPVLGINTFIFTTPFFWDGASNLIIEICGGDPNSASDTYFTNNSAVTWTTGLSFNGSRVYAADNGGNECGNAPTTNGSATTTATSRPNIVFNWTSAAPCTSPPNPGTATANPGSVCGGTPVNLTLTGVSFGSGQTYQWESAPATAGPYTSIGSSSVSPFYTITAPGTTTYYRCAVTCGGNTQFSVPVAVIVNSSTPIPVVTATPDGNVCNGTSVSLATTECTACTYTWNTGATTSSINVTTAGYYSVTVANSCGSAVASKEVIIAPSPSLSISAGTALCQGSSVQIEANGASSYSWSPATGLNTTTGAVVIASPTTTTTYTVTGTIGSCTKTLSVTITVNAVPAAPTVSASGSTTFCTGGSVTLTSTAAAGYQWYKDGTAIQGATSQTHLVSTAGSYAARAVANGCSSNASAATVVTVNAIPPQPTITQAGNSLQSSAASGNQWLLNNAAIAGATGQSYTPTTSGSYTVQVTQNGCTGTASAPFSYTITATNDPVLDRKITVAPNPVRDDLNIKYNGTGARFSVMLMNMHGAVLLRSSFASNYTINMSKYSAGLYVVRIVNERSGEKIQRMIMKQ
ncbi:MAG: T9SS type A sorting domain-containing protein [Chitinophagaceae bacterium]|nr:T9SS type A sorting domain-containing protein [Chitinophagaceae bacterium]